MTAGTASATAPDAAADAALPPELLRIIATGRRQRPVRRGSRMSAALLAALSLLLLWVSFTPLEFAPAAWLALVPLCCLVRLSTLPSRCYLHLSLLGFAWALVTLQWMRLGHPAMYGALVALAFYVGLYIPAFVGLSRRAVSGGLPLWLAVPVVWTALEYLRAYLLTGFSWYYLGHTQYRWLTLIQVADLTGTYGVSFVIALTNACVAGLLPVSLLQRLRLDIGGSGSGRETPAVADLRAWPVAALPVVVVGACCLYGVVRIQDPAEFGAGPSVALIQGNFTPEVKHDPDSWMRRYAIHDRLTRHCVDLQPDLIVWPETMFPWPDRSVADGTTDEQLLARLPPMLQEEGGFDEQAIAAAWRSQEVRQSLADHSRMVGAALVMGIEAHVVSAQALQAFNSVAFIRPDLGYVGRYDKMHRVIFGEYIPLKDLFPWLSNLTPFGPNYGISAGDAPRLFEYGGFRLAPLICFEDTVPQVVRRIAGQRTKDGAACDLLVNLTNDAWFRGSSELDQHLITAAFRCVETRTPLVRAVNGGISAFIDGNGQIREPAQILQIDDNVREYRPELTPLQGLRDPATGRWRRQFSGIVFGQVPLDSRDSLYLRTGDWFAAGCLLVLCGAWLRGWRRDSHTAPQ